MLSIRPEWPLGRQTIRGSQFISLMLTSGGDRRITVARGSNTNLYGASPFPRSTLGYGSSTANDISLGAFHHLEQFVAERPAGALLDPVAYGDTLEDLRARLKTAWGVRDTTDVVFAPSGTDLEFVALAISAARSGRPVTNILLGQDEVGSGCILSAAGRYFAAETGVCSSTPKGEAIAGLGETSILNIPVRTADGTPVQSAVAAAQIDILASQARAQRRHALVHVVHGSKTGLVLPSMVEIDALRAAHGDHLTFVVDACQARIEGAQINGYLSREAIVLLTGSKFMGGPPFSGFALVPSSLAPPQPIAGGLATIFRRGEWPMGWQTCSALPETANPGLLLRLEAALFELERFGTVESAAKRRIIAQFRGAVFALAKRLDAGIVYPSLAGHGLHEATLATLDISTAPGRADFAVAQRWHRVLAARGLRLGQPVRCLRREDGNWAGTLRISLSMPLISALSTLDDDQLAHRFEGDMAQIANVLEAAQRPVVA